MLAAAVAAFAAGLGLLSLATTSLEEWPLPMLAVLATSLALLAIYAWREYARIDPTIVVTLGGCLIAAALCGGLPLYFGALGLSGVFHRSVVSATALIGLSLPTTSSALFYLRGASPGADDAARLPTLLAPVVMALALYALLLVNLLQRGIQQLQTVGPIVLVRPMLPAYLSDSGAQTGLLNQLLGTCLLVVMTVAAAAPVGVAVGLFVSEVGRGPLVQVVNFSSIALRGVSVFVLALSTTTLVGATRETPLGLLFAGARDRFGQIDAGRGSFLTAAIALALLTMPLIARATQEGCRSLPSGLREGSAALGATPDYTLLRITLPWALPYIITGVILSAAEAAGSLAVIIFMPGTGEYGVGPFKEVATLPSVIFGAQYNATLSWHNLEGGVQFVAGALLLLLALGLTSLALAFKRHFARAAGGTA
jgi:phosphate transport system permease protein